jgi:hypothetical protein
MPDQALIQGMGATYELVKQGAAIAECGSVTPDWPVSADDDKSFAEWQGYLEKARGHVSEVEAALEIIKHELESAKRGEARDWRDS